MTLGRLLMYGELALNLSFQARKDILNSARCGWSASNV